MVYHKFTIGGCAVSGFCVCDNGAVVDFAGTLRNSYTDYKRASAAARRKYGDSTITVTEIKPQKRRYRVPMSKLLEISEPID